MNEHELNLADYSRILFKWRWVFIGTFVLVMLSVYLYTKFEEPQYQATIEIKIDKKDKEPSIWDPFSAAPDLSTEIRVIKSLSIIRKAVENIEVLPNDPDVRERQLTFLARQYQSTTKVAQIENTNIVTIQTFSNDAKTAAMLANAIVDVFNVDGIKNRSREATAVLEYTENQINELKANIKKSEELLLHFQQDESVFVVTPEVKANLDRMTIDNTFEFEKKMVKIESQLADYEGYFEKKNNELINKAFEKIHPSNNYIFAGLRRQMLEMEFDRYLLLIDYTESHPNVMAQDQAINLVRNDLLSLIKQYIPGPYSKMMEKDMMLMISEVMLQIRQEVVYRIINKFYSDIGSLSPDQIEYQGLKREIDHMLVRYGKLIEKKENTQIAMVSEILDLKVISPAVVPKMPFKPNMQVNLMVGAVAAVILGLILVLMLEGSDTSIGTIEDIERIIPYPILGLIPFVRVDPDDINWEGRVYQKDERLCKKIRSFVTIFLPKTHEAESYLTLRTNLAHIMETEHKKVILFTSPMQKEGKTTIALNTAISMAQLGKKTILIDANMRKPSVDKMFGIERKPGLTDVLMGQVPWRNAVKTATDLLLGEVDVDKLLEVPGICNLNVLTAGESVLNPSVILNSTKLEQLFRELKQVFDAVIVVCSPVLLMADSTALSSKVDGVVMIGQMNKTKKENLKRAGMHLKQVEAHIMGVVLNQVKSSSLLGGSVNLQHYYGEAKKSQVGSKLKKIISAI